MSFLKPKTLAVCILAALCLVANNRLTRASNANSSNLRLAGTVVAVEGLFGHIYNEKQAVSSLLIVRVDRVIEGREDAKYILVRYKWRSQGHEGDPVDRHVTQWEFTLTKANMPPSTLKDMQYVRSGSDEKTFGITPRFQRTWETASELLPLDVRLPLYESQFDQISKIPTSTLIQENAPNTDLTFYVLEQERWMNFPGSPVKIVLFTGHLLFNNNTDKTIENFTLGCVNADGAVVKRLKTTHQVLEPKAGSLWVTDGGTSEQADQFYICRERKSKLAVVEARLDDGTVWKAK
jgi:hypothetical protein